MIDQQDITGGLLTDAPNDKYKKFFDKFKDNDKLNIEEWKPVNLIGFFAKKYYDTYKVKYKFKFNSPSPSKCFEVFQIKKLASMLSSDPKILKNYIDWVFETKVVKAKRRLTSISFMTIDDIVNDYKFNILLKQNHNNTITRSTLLPIVYQNIFKEVGFAISNYGDLAFLNKMNDKPNNLLLAFESAECQGLDLSILDKVI